MWELRNTDLNLTIQIPEEDLRALNLKANAQGLSPEQYALQVIERDLAPDWLRKSWAAAQEAGIGQMTMEEIDAEITEARRIRRIAKQG